MSRHVFGTWDMPKYINRKMADSLNGTEAAKEIKKCRRNRVHQEKHSLDPRKNLNKLIPIDDSDNPPQNITVPNVSEEDSKIIPEKDIIAKEKVHAEGQPFPQKRILCPIHDLYDSGKYK
ncbi:uncharacterized protein [Leptinotarsa decemlineata]|uniref:uncharacterized protein n=1 Tax=Leptinotarsa decemlineata TaxID=7539 RepID=UPI003D306EDE